jgi:BirA family transcriptional regulator, biotin operon repressor / biotin---[acetyl-CoA-carboxylase] ligase
MSEGTGAATATRAGCVHFYERLGSTNDEAKRLAREGAGAGTIVFAREQTSGRGRRGRIWVSPRGNLYCSVILRPDCDPARAAQLGFAAALAVGEAVLVLLPPECRLGFKWPNDILLNGRKCGGILLEAETTPGGRIAWIVIGIGINTGSAPLGTEFPATDLRREAGVAVRPEILLDAMAARLFAWVEIWQEQGFAPVRSSWLGRAENLGGAITVRLGDRCLDGRFVDLDAEGALLLDAEDGRHRIAAGEIFPASA